MSFDYAALFWALRPETALVVGALLVLSLDLSLLKGRSADARHGIALGLGSLALVVAAWLAWIGPHGPVFGGVFILDRLATATRVGVLSLTLLAMGTASCNRSGRNPAELVAVILFAAVGFTLMAAAQQLLVAFLSLELASLSLYILAGFDKSRPESAEAGLKYYLFGGMAAAFLLFGLSLVYGLTGSIDSPVIAERLSSQPPNALLMVALVMVLVAFGFKAAAAPFHLWAPDVYEGAPTVSASLVASASKLAAFTLFTRILWTGFYPVAGSIATTAVTPGWLAPLAAIAALSMLIGNFGALAQQNVRRLLAYSAIAHSGVLMLGVMAAGDYGVGPLFYYASTYGIAAAGAFAVVGVVEASGGCQNVTDLAGLARRSPLLAGCLSVYILSLAGIPPLAGFFGKFSVFAAALRLGGLAGPAGWLVVLAIALSAVALYYYLVVLKQALVEAPAPGAGKIAIPAAAEVTLVAAAVMLILLGVRPSLILGLF